VTVKPHGKRSRVPFPAATDVRSPGFRARSDGSQLRAVYSAAAYLEKNPSTSGTDISFHDMSHGESFLELAVDRFQGRGLWVSTNRSRPSPSLAVSAFARF
jgi:predicted ATPase